jgi:hypothetical protein
VSSTHRALKQVAVRFHPSSEIPSFTRNFILTGARKPRTLYDRIHFTNLCKYNSHSVVKNSSDSRAAEC